MNPNHLSFVDVFKVGVKEIDDQHNQLLVIVNELNSAALFEMTPQEFKEKADAVVDFALHHFRTEEGYMLQLGPDPDSEIHKGMHENLLNQLESIRGMRLPNEAAVKLVEFMRLWLVEHILRNDVLLGRKLNAIGVH